MTGFGSASFTVGSLDFDVEIKSVNHKFLEVKLKTPEMFHQLEFFIKDQFKKNFSRGQFYIAIKHSKDSTPEVSINEDLAKEYFATAKNLQDSLGIDNGLNMDSLLRLPGVVAFESSKELKEEDIKAGLKEAMFEAFGILKDMRSKEGAALKEDMEEKLQNIEVLYKSSSEALPELIKKYREDLKANIQELVGDGTVDESRIITEAAIYSERIDVAEEVTRLGSHIKQFRDYMDLKEPVGRRLDFLCQEIFREINTLGTKVGDAQVKKNSVEMKGELEKIREQVQNAE